MTLTDEFTAQRPRLLRIAYRLLGSIADAEDVLQEAWLRLDRMPEPGEIRNLSGMLATIVSHLAYDHLGSAAVRREHYVGQWLPEPLVEELDPSEQVTLDETVSMALMVVLEQLSPAERTAFILHDSFGMPFSEIASVVGRSPDAVRQLASRARRRVRSALPSQPVDVQRHRELLIPLRLPGAGGRAMANGGLLPAAAGPRGSQTFDAWLASPDATRPAMRLTGAVSNPQVERRLRQAAKLRKALLKNQPAELPPSLPLPVANGAYRTAALGVLRAATEPMTPKQVQQEVAKAMGVPVAYVTIATFLSRTARRDGSAISRVGKGLYELGGGPASRNHTKI